MSLDLDAIRERVAVFATALEAAVTEMQNLINAEVESLRAELVSLQDSPETPMSMARRINKALPNALLNSEFPGIRARAERKYGEMIKPGQKWKHNDVTGTIVTVDAVFESTVNVRQGFFPMQIDKGNFLRTYTMIE